MHINSDQTAKAPPIQSAPYHFRSPIFFLASSDLFLFIKIKYKILGEGAGRGNGIVNINVKG